jgi:NADH dehydrogenase
MAAARRLQDIGVEVLLKATVESVDGSGVHLADGRDLRAATIVWTAGVKASPLAAGLGAQLASGGRVKTLPTLQLEAHPEVLVAGDMAYIERMGAPLPQLAPVALQQGKTAARNIAAMVRNTALSDFHYFDRGTMATIGRNAAVVQIGRLHFSGFAGWVIWLAVHLVNLITFRSRVIVLINWAYDYLFYDRPVRLMLRAEREGG